MSSFSLRCLSLKQLCVNLFAYHDVAESLSKHCILLSTHYLTSYRPALCEGFGEGLTESHTGLWPVVLNESIIQDQFLIHLELWRIYFLTVVTHQCVWVRNRYLGGFRVAYPSYSQTWVKLDLFCLYWDAVSKVKRRKNIYSCWHTPGDSLWLCTCF